MADEQTPQQSTSTAPVNPLASSGHNVRAALSYLLGFITGIFFLLTDKDDFVRFHATQSTLTFVVLFVIGFIPVIGWMLSPFIALVSFILWLVLMFKAYSGERFHLPIVGDLAEQWKDKMKA